MAGEPSLYFWSIKDFNDRLNATSDSWYGIASRSRTRPLQTSARASAPTKARSKFPNQLGVRLDLPSGRRHLAHARSGSDLDELEQRKYAATALFASLDDQENSVLREHGIPMKVRGRVQDILAYARWAAYSIFTGSTYTAAQQLAWAGRYADRPIGRGGPRHADSEV